jgi:uncharacterized protein (DUF697 family)
MNAENEYVTLETETTQSSHKEEACEIAVIVDTAEVEKAIRKSVYASMGIGIVPLPLFNVAAVTGSNLILARRLSELYGVEFKEGVAKKIIISIIGAGTGVAASPWVESLVAGIPLIGLPLTIGTKPALNGMTTYALGRMFVTHFERGGSFIGSNWDSMKEDFAAAFKNSREWLGDTIKGKEKAETA